MNTLFAGGCAIAPMKDVKHCSTLEKALEINLDSGRYGTFAEIGAGQEVVRWFFQAGGAAGTVSKSISAYDMKVSDAIYGECSRYVCRERLEAMLEHEQMLNRQRLSAARGESTRFFTFADTVSARNYQGTNECHAWLGIRFQQEPLAEDSSIILHVRMLDDTNALQQEALGIVGVNLIFGAYELHDHPDALVESLIDGISSKRVEIDMLDTSGPVFDGVDNRVMSLRLVEHGLTGAAMFSSNGIVLQPSEVLRKRSLVVERGRFRPVTYFNIDMLNSATKKFTLEYGEAAADPLPIMEMSLHSLLEDGAICLEDFVSRAEVLGATGHTVMISDFQEYYRLAAYLCRYTDKPVGLAMGLGALRNLFDERFYENLDGGILESLGRLFNAQLKLLIYPAKDKYTGAVEGMENLKLGQSLHHLFNYLSDRKCIVPLDDISIQYLDIHSPDVLAMIRHGGEWGKLVPKGVSDVIVKQKLFGYGTG